jgi:hypothetical protein
MTKIGNTTTGLSNILLCAEIMCERSKSCDVAISIASCTRLARKSPDHLADAASRRARDRREEVYPAPYARVSPCSLRRGLVQEESWQFIDHMERPSDVVEGLAGTELPELVDSENVGLH